MSSNEMAALAPFVTLVVGLAVALPMLIILFIAKMYLWTQLTGGANGPQTVTTSVGGGKEEVLARRLADALPAFQNAIGKYVFDGRSVGAPKNVTTKPM
ncbi:hypothetical protein V5799_018947 [Amblyomma americanum]|uniref:Uncharacterized protein n=1 Tax=Amblyomma americanum TaxID=6943 RepID=A0AAQ4EYT4_AMBAM